MGIGKMRNDQPTASGHAASFQSFHHAQILQGEEGAVGLAEVERHGVDESGDVGAVHVHHVREVEKARKAAGKVFGDVAARQRRRAFDGQVRWVFRERFIERFGAGTPEGVQRGKKGRELQAEGFSDGEALLVALFHEGGRALRERGSEEIKVLPVFDAGKIEEALRHVNDGIRRGERSRGRRRDACHLRRELVQKLAQQGFFPDGGVGDLVFHGFEMERGVVGGERSDERHVCRLTDGDRHGSLRLLEGTVGLHRAPAAVQEEQALPLFHVGQHFLGDSLMIACAGEDKKDVGLAGFFERACHGQVEGGIHLAADIERMRLPELSLLFVSDVDREGDGDEMQIGGGSESCRSRTDDGNFHKRSSIR